MNITKATTEDIPALTLLVNSAYRGEGAKRGWTTEADLLDGIRTSESSLALTMHKEGAVVFTSKTETGMPTGCVYLQREPDTFYLGMLTVSPALQAAGIGKLLLKYAEEYVQQEGGDNITMTVISVRHELIAWYQRHGYVKTGVTKPFPTDHAFGIPRQSLEFIVLNKRFKQV